MKDTSNQKPKRTQVNYILVLGGGYLLYTAFSLFQRLWSGVTENPAINIGGGLLFALTGAGMLVQEWRVFRRSQKQEERPEETDEEQEP